MKGEFNQQLAVPVNHNLCNLFIPGISTVVLVARSLVIGVDSDFVKYTLYLDRLTCGGAVHFSTKVPSSRNDASRFNGLGTAVITKLCKL